MRVGLGRFGFRWRYADGNGPALVSPPVGRDLQRHGHKRDPEHGARAPLGGRIVLVETVAIRGQAGGGGGVGHGAASGFTARCGWR